MLLAFMLHPDNVSTFRKMVMYNNSMNVMAMTSYTILYYKMMIGDDFAALTYEVNQWHHDQLPIIKCTRREITTGFGTLCHQ